METIACMLGKSDNTLGNGKHQEIRDWKVGKTIPKGNGNGGKGSLRNISEKLVGGSFDLRQSILRNRPRTELLSKISD